MVPYFFCICLSTNKYQKYKYKLGDQLDKSSVADMQDFSRLLLLLTALSFKAAEAKFDFEGASPVSGEEMVKRWNSL